MDVRKTIRDSITIMHLPDGGYKLTSPYLEHLGNFAPVFIPPLDYATENVTEALAPHIERLASNLASLVQIRDAMLSLE